MFRARSRAAFPDLPIVTLAEAKATIAARARQTGRRWCGRQDRERWNDWGIGLLLQGDLKGAEYAFKKVTEAEPGYADGWLNVARALIQEGETEAAKPFIEKALASQSAARPHLFLQGADPEGRWRLRRRARDRCARRECKYPRDRVVLNQIARILFLKRQYADAVEVLERVVRWSIPEDLQMHYTVMLCYRGLGDAAKAAREEKLFRASRPTNRRRPSPASRRLVSPEDNNERQPIHDHESVALTGGGGDEATLWHRPFLAGALWAP